MQSQLRPDTGFSAENSAPAEKIVMLCRQGDIAEPAELARIAAAAAEDAGHGVRPGLVGQRFVEVEEAAAFCKGRQAAVHSGTDAPAHGGIG